MRVLFDAFWWVRGPIANRIVMRELVTAWHESYPEDELVLAVRSKHMETARADVPSGVQLVASRLAPHALVNALELVAIARRVRPDVSIVHNYAPLLTPSAVFIHDLLFEERSEWFTRKERLYFWPMSRLARRARAVVTSSRTEADRIERLHPELAPVRHVGLAVSRSLAMAAPRQPQLAIQENRFLLCVGRLNRRKNLGTAIDGVLRSSAAKDGVPLVIVGSSEYSGAAPDLPSDLQVHVDEGRIIFAGRVSDAELRWLYENASAMIFLSRDEGFGLPPAEARHFGTPAIVSDIPVMREVAVGARLVDPESPDAVAEQIDHILDAAASDAVRAVPREIGPAWNDVARRLRAAVLGGSDR